MTLPQRCETECQVGHTYALSNGYIQGKLVSIVERVACRFFVRCTRQS